MIARWVLDRPVNADAFLTYVTRILMPELDRGEESANTSPHADMMQTDR